MTFGFFRKINFGVGSPKLRMMFLLGQPENATVNRMVREEARRHGDLLQIDMPDSYRSLAYKSVAGASQQDV